MSIKIILDGPVISKDNKGRTWNAKGGYYFLDTRYKNYQEHVASVARFQMKELPPLEGDLMVEFQFYFKNRVRYDLLNAPKGICDAFNKVVWLDDKQIVIGSLYVNYDKMRPRTEITITKLTPKENA